MVKIVTDSTSDITPALAEELGIQVVPLNVSFGADTWKDGTEMAPQRFYEELKSNKNHPKTSQPSPEEFRTVYQKLIQDGDEVISIHISSKLSGTINSARLAAQLMETDRISFVDTLVASTPLALIVLQAVKLANAGKSRQEIMAVMNETVKNLRLFILFDTLEFLQKGGRIGRASALIGSLLSIKPILTFVDGITTPVEKVRSLQKGYQRIREFIDAFIAENPGKNYHFGFCYSSEKENLNRLLEPFPVNHPARQAEIIAQLGAVVGTYSGPGMIGVGFYAD